MIKNTLLYLEKHYIEPFCFLHEPNGISTHFLLLLKLKYEVSVSLTEWLSLITEHWDISIIQYCYYGFFFNEKRI